MKKEQEKRQAELMIQFQHEQERVEKEQKKRRQ